MQCTIPWAPSTSTGIPCAWARSMTSFIGFTIPSTLEICSTAIILTLLPNSPLKASISHMPFSSTGITLIEAPAAWQAICQGTIFEWCESPDIIISSPSPRNFLQKLLATRFTDAVVPLVKMMFSLAGAFMNSLTFSLAPSYKAVASSLSLCIARCTLALAPQCILFTRSITHCGFCEVAPLSRYTNGLPHTLCPNAGNWPLISSIGFILYILNTQNYKTYHYFCIKI